MIWLAVGIVIGVIVSIVGGILAMCVAGRRADRREIAEGWRRSNFIGLVGMVCNHRDRVAVAQGKYGGDPAWAYAAAMRVDPECLPNCLDAAAWQFVSDVSDGREPDWVEYLPEDKS